MAGRTTAAVLAGLALMAAGCGEDDDDAPVRTVVRTQTVAVGTPPTLPDTVPERRGRRVSFFAASSPWNVSVLDRPAEPDSDLLLQRAQLRTALVERRGRSGVAEIQRRVREGIYINTVKWTTPIVTDHDGIRTRVRCRQVLCGRDARDLTTLTIPPRENPDPRYDGWFTVVDTQARVAWDLWRARRERDRSISFLFAKRWDLDGPGFQRPNGVSARGSGLPLFAGVIRPSSIRSGNLEHALAISVPGPAQRNYVQPASSTNGDGRVDSLPLGARIRLRRDVSLGRLAGAANRTTARTLVRALQTYGAIVVDRAGVPTLYAQKNFDWGGFSALDRRLDTRRRRLEALKRRIGVSDRELTRLSRDPKNLDRRDARRRIRRRTVDRQLVEVNRLIQRRARGRLIEGSELQNIRLSDFEVVELGERRTYPASTTNQAGGGR